MSKFENICIYFSDTGGGHRSAVEAIAAGVCHIVELEHAGRAISIVRETVPEKSHPINNVFVQLYNFLLRNHQPLMQHYYWFLHAMRPNNSWLGYALVRNYLKELLYQNKPSVIVSVHPMTNHYLARAMVEAGLKGKIKLITVVTDPNANLWKGWACEEADIIIAPNSLVRERLVEWGISGNRVKVVGMPVHPSFLQPPLVAPDKFRIGLGLQPDRLTVCINAGWAGSTRMLDVWRCLALSKKTLQAIFLCGHNKDLYKQMLQVAKTAVVPTAVLPFYEDMSNLMSACDLMVTKAGGLTTFQCLAKHLPMALDAISAPMPQERGTVDLLVQQKLAWVLRNAQDIVDIVDHLAPKASNLANPLSVLASDELNLGQPGAIFEIARIILNNSQSHNIENQKTQNSLEPAPKTADLSTNWGTELPA